MARWSCRPRGSEQDDLAAFFDEAQCGVLGNFVAVESGLEVEIGRRFADWIVRKAKASAHPLGASRFALDAEQALKDLSRGELLLERAVQLSLSPAPINRAVSRDSRDRGSHALAAD